MSQYIHAVPNFSDGSRPEVIEAVVGTVRHWPGVKLIGHYPDPDFNRTVVELIGEVGAMKEALVAMAAKSIELIDMEKQSGAHVRIGAQDTIPIFPTRNITLEECVAIAKEIGQAVNEKTKVPVFFAGENASSQERKALDFIRAGQYEGLRDILLGSNPPASRMPDIGDVKEFLHKGGTVVSAGVTPLVAINYILSTNDLALAKAISKGIRGPSGGFTNVRSTGLMFTDRDRAVVSINLFNHEDTPIHRTYHFVKTEAAAYGVSIERTQLVGTVPQAALVRAAEYFLQIENFQPEQIRENHLLDLKGS